MLKGAVGNQGRQPLQPCKHQLIGRRSNGVDPRVHFNSDNLVGGLDEVVWSRASGEV